MKREPHSTTHRENLARLARIEGQIRGIQRMIEEGAYCIDICTQIQAVRAALHVLGLKILRKHLRSCLATAARRRSGRDFELKVEEIMRLLKRRELSL